MTAERSFDSDRVRIELCRVATVNLETAQLDTRHGAEVWLSGDDGKILRIRKPAVTLVDETRPALLRQIADWMEDRDDPSLSLLVSEYRSETRQAGEH
jgi:hypothetical protein